MSPRLLGIPRRRACRLMTDPSARVMSSCAGSEDARSATRQMSCRYRDCDDLLGSLVSTERLRLRTPATGIAFALEATCWGSCAFGVAVVNASSAPNLRFFDAPPKEPKPICAAISGSISISMFTVAADGSVVRCPGRSMERHGSRKLVSAQS